MGTPRHDDADFRKAGSMVRVPERSVRGSLTLGFIAV